MLYYLSFFLFCTGALASVIQTNKPQYALEDAQTHFEDFIKNFDRKYANDEFEKKIRFDIFKQNLAKINARNMDPEEDAVFNINNFADMTEEELESYKGFVAPTVECTLMSDPKTAVPFSDDIHKCKTQTYYDADIDIPDSLDWREKNAVSSVKNQGTCGSCWTFGTTGNVESMYAIKHQEIVDFSEQQLVDCDTLNNGCKGGTFNNSFGGLVTIGGMMKLEDYPYEASKGECRFDKSKVAVKLTDCIVYDLKDEEQLRNYLATNGPIAISIDANDFFDYDSGILNKCTAGALNHAVLLVGYGTENDTPYWIIKNSWGSGWGENGYVKVKRNVNACNLVNPCAATAVVE